MAREPKRSCFRTNFCDFRFRFSRLRHHRHVILHLPAKFCPNRTIRDRVINDAISIFQDGGNGITILLPVSFFVTSLIWKGRYLSAEQISAIYPNPWLRYYYFWFLKTNGRHVGISLPVSIFTFASPSACYSANLV